MLTVEDKYIQIDDLLDKMAEEVQLNKARYDRMIGHYEAVKNWIEADEVFFKPYKYDVYPHGSVRILTTVKPIGRDEFDLDVAIHLKTNWNLHTPTEIYNHVKRRLEEHADYKAMLEPKNRCLRLNYAGDFHMDILPGIQENEIDQNKLRVPDHELGSWVSSNPRGYANWFISRVNLVKVSLLEKALKAEKIPADNFNNKKPLQRAVQLIKRYRDMYFQKDDTYKTSSVILTTIAGHFYEGEESIFNAIDGIISKIHSNISSSPTRLKILNPVNPAEDFTDKWDSEPQYYYHFVAFCNHLFNEWQKLKKEQGVLTESKILRGLFGDDLFLRAQTSQAKGIEQLREKKAIGINKGTGIISSIGTAATMPIKTNTFFGGNHDIPE
jgi:hypothetical protein